jgi:hypothetical protein
MKAKKSYSGLESFPLSFSTRQPELLSVSGNDANMRLINDLFDSGAEEEARRMLRKTLAEVTRNLDAILADGGDVSVKAEPDMVASLALSVEI